MKISPAHNPRRAHRDSGFSLLEILVVLAIMGVMLSLVGTRMVSSIEATRFAKTVDAAAADVRLIRAEAMLNNQPRYIVTDTNARIDIDDINPAHLRRLSLPTDWRVAGEVMTITPNGYCAGGQLRILTPTGRAADYVFTPPKCEATRIAQGAL